MIFKDVAAINVGDLMAASGESPCARRRNLFFDRGFILATVASAVAVLIVSVHPVFENLHFGLVERLANFAVEAIALLGYPGVFFLMLLESALIPIPSEVIMPFSGYLCYLGVFDFTTVVMMGALGNLAGSLLAYALGLKYGRPFIEKYGKYLLLKREVLELCERLFSKYGDIIVFVSRMLPAVRTYISFPAGLGKMNPLKFSIYTFVGSVPWCVLLTYLGLMLGPYWETVLAFFRRLDIGIAAVAVIFLIYVFFFQPSFLSIFFSSRRCSNM